MNVTVNGERHAFDDGASVTTLVTRVTGRELEASGQASDGRKLGVAVALNSEVVPRSLWATTALADGDQLELVTAVQGG
ncbi:sulfur carrier protein ThiS [Arthrobacter sp. M4]|uniref:sulfur carrier protein ThiS n=1 Tax=Arthrobacter sp. M4 TaxID=218160 RepID=UPI001CDCEC3F|nr:sulfur carrier protein ThiS [Arthrobacter sp. M4]MCA4132348.1 sulfur carrier protein ThiS [Arthrobacter sp. M4]